MFGEPETRENKKREGDGCRCVECEEALLCCAMCGQDRWEKRGRAVFIGCRNGEMMG